MTPPRRLLTTHVELHVAVLLFGVAGLFGKLVSAGPLVIVAGRTVFGALALGVVIRLSSRPLAARQPGLLVLSGLVLAFHWLTFFHAIQLSTVAVGLIGFAAFPMFVTFFEPLVTQQRIRGVDIASAILVFVGLLIVAPSFDVGDLETLGLLVAVLSGFLFAVLALMNRRLIASNSSLNVTFFQQAVAALAVLPLAMQAPTRPGSDAVLLLLALGVLCTALPHALFVRALATVKAQLASVVTGLEPVYGIVLAALLLDEIPGPKTLTGGFVVLTAVVLASAAHAPPPTHRK